jgi:hypothetical protein
MQSMIDSEMIHAKVEIIRGKTEQFSSRLGHYYIVCLSIQCRLLVER